MAEKVEFGISLSEVIADAFGGWRANVVPLTVAGLATIGVSNAVSFGARAVTDNGVAWSLLTFAGWVIAGTIAYPWFHYALQAVDGDKVDLRAPFEHPKRFRYQLVASFWFWAGFLLGFGFFLLPGLLVLVFYAFYGYIIADGAQESGTKALGTSVILGEKRRIGLLWFSLLFLAFSALGLLLGVVAAAAPTAALALATVGLTITTSIVIVAGASIYRKLQGLTR